MLSLEVLDPRLDPVALTEMKGWAVSLPYDMDGCNYIVGFKTKEDAELVAQALRLTFEVSSNPDSCISLNYILRILRENRFKGKAIFTR